VLREKLEEVRQLLADGEAMEETDGPQSTQTA
jgi:hypothetical protein